MTILSLSKGEREATVVLDATELVKLCNVMHFVPEDRRKEWYYKLYSALMIASDIVQYGHIDAFCLKKIVELRSHLEHDRKEDDEGERNL